MKTAWVEDQLQITVEEMLKLHLSEHFLFLPQPPKPTERRAPASLCRN